MKMVGLMLMVIVVFAGCAGFQHSEVIETDQSNGFAVGRYSNSSGGPSGSFVFAGTGGGWGSGGAGGFGLGALAINSGPPQISPYKFARSVSMINYSKRLKTIKYDEAGGIIDYEFDYKPITSSSYQPSSGQVPLPSSFGHQPIE